MVVVRDGGFDGFRAQVGQIAESFLAASTDEVAVAASFAACDFGEDQAGGASGVVAAVAEESAFEVVLVDAVALAGCATRVQDVLYLVEQFLSDDGLVPAPVDLALVAQEADLVGVGEHLVQGAVGERGVVAP